MSNLDATVKQIWAHLHTIPEKGNCEFKTAAYIAERLRSFGYDVTENVGSTGVVALLDSGNVGPAFGIRADMDALVHMVDGQETAIHSCGHDAHSAILLTAAQEVARRGIKSGKLKLVFQPAEELLSGAQLLVEAGVVDDLDYLIGLHLRPIQEAKMGQATAALCHGAINLLEATLHGVPAHGARPHLGVNVLNAGAAVINAVNAVKTRPEVPATTKVTRFIADAGVINALPESARLAIDMRAQTNEVMEELLAKTRQALEFGAKTVGATVEITREGSCPGAQYSDEVVALLSEAITEVMGEAALIPPIISPGSEDFHFFAQHNPKLKTGYMGLGVDLEPGLHHPKMHFNQDGLINGVNTLLKMVEKLNGLQ